MKKMVNKGRIWTTYKTATGYKGTILPYRIEQLSAKNDIMAELGIERCA